MSAGDTWVQKDGFLITAVDCKNCKDKQSGQSVLEFLLMFPMLIGMTVMMIRVNTAIQISIVDQQYARAQALFLTYNSAWYPELNKYQRLIDNSTNQMVVGVSDNSAGSTATTGSTYTPKATEQLIARNPRISAPDAPHEEPKIRAKVRIRNTVTLCTPTLFMPGQGGGAQAILALAMGNPIRAVGPVMLGEGSRFNNFCGSPIPYE